MKFYILVDPDKSNVYKVGITKNPKQRLKSYRTAAPQCYFHQIYDIPDASHEKAIFYELSGAFPMDKEVVRGPLSLVQNIIEGYLLEKELL
jgi:hypothetical protein